MLLNAAAMAAGGYAFNALSAPGAASGGMSAGGTFANAPGLSFSNAAIADGMSLGAGGFSGVATGAGIGSAGIGAAASGALGMGPATWAGLSNAGSNVGFAGVPDLSYIDTFNLGTAGNNIAGTNQALGGTAGNIGSTGINEATTNVVDNAISGVGPNSSNVINNIPGSNPAPPGSDMSAWDKLTDAGKKVFTDPDGTVNWTRVARAGLLGANVLSGVLGSVPDGGGDGSGGAGQNPYVAPDWVTGKLPDRPDPGNYMDRSGEWTPGLSPGEQSNLLAMGKAPPKDYTQNNAVPFQPQRMLVDPSLNTLPKQQNMPALPGAPQGLGGINPNYVPTGDSPFSNLTPEQIEALRRQNPNPNRGGRQAAPGGLPPLQALQSLSNLPRGY